MLVVFAVGSCIMRDWVQSKPWLGLIGVLSSSLAIVSSIGFLSYCGVDFNEIVSLMPFLILGESPLIRSLITDRHPKGLTEKRLPINRKTVNG